MNVVYPTGSCNVGDELNGWMWNTLLADFHDPDTALLGVGTLLNQEFCKRLADKRRVLVFGTGAGYGSVPTIDARWKFYAVRGAGTARCLGLSADKAVADASYLLATLDWQSMSRREGKIVVVPHHRSLRLLDWSRLCAESGLTFVSPLLSADLFMKQLCSADLVLSEAMHGAILADIARVPWRAFSFGRHFNTEKWRDWGDAFDLKLELTQLHGFYDPSFYLSDRPRLKHLMLGAKAFASKGSLGKKKWKTVTPPGWPLGKAINGAVQALRSLAAMEGQLSDINIYRSRVAMLYERLDSLRRDHGLAIGGVMSGDPLPYLSKGVVQ
ncbi:hypothetical protein D7241_13705 [Stutzerimonas sp. VN223-3]|uniref:polysaccharide pyruvyl transferase family protein n=1 Tax=Stutzerimonas sp. VN223-3 TaxID=3384601 RepID=UPI0038B67A21